MFSKNIKFKKNHNFIEDWKIFLLPESCHVLRSKLALTTLYSEFLMYYDALPTFSAPAVLHTKGNMKQAMQSGTQDSILS